MKKFWLLLLPLLLLSIIFSPLIEASIDEKVRDIVQRTDKGFLDTSMSYITYLGDGRVNFSIASLLPDQEARRDAQKSFIVSGLTTILLKPIIGKARPPREIEYEHFTINSSHHAMPSGHTATAFALATTISYHYPKYRRLAFTLATLVAISRLYQDAHWISDVVAGAGVGYLSARFVEYRW